MILLADVGNSRIKWVGCEEDEFRLRGQAGHGDEIQLTDALRRLDRTIGLVTKCRRYDIGDKLGWMKSSIELCLEREEFAEELRAFLNTLNCSEKIA